MATDDIPYLENAAEDLAVSACRTTLKVATTILPIPVVGPLLGEVIGNMIPDLRGSSA